MYHMYPFAESTCPFGRHRDQVYKVSALYRQSAAHSRSSGISGSLGSGFALGVSLGNKHSQHPLRATLAPPSKPIALQVVRWPVYLCLAPLAANIAVLSAGPFRQISPFTAFALIALAATIFCCILALDLWESAHTQRTAQRRLWNQLYYCSRDDVVFFPNGRPIPAEEMRGYLYRVAIGKEPA